MTAADLHLSPARWIPSPASQDVAIFNPGQGLGVAQMSVARDKNGSLDNVSFEAPAGEITVLIGRRPVDMALLLDTIFGFVHPSAGKISIGDKDITLASIDTRKALGLAYSSHSFGVFRSLSVLQNMQYVDSDYMGFGMPLSKVLRTSSQNTHQGSSDDIVRGVLDLLELDNLRHLPVHSLSTQMQRRVVLARTLIHKPSVLMIGTMLSSLNEVDSAAMVRLLLCIQRRWRPTILLPECDERVALPDSFYIVRVDSCHRAPEQHQ